VMQPIEEPIIKEKIDAVIKSPGNKKDAGIRLKLIAIAELTPFIIPKKLEKIELAIKIKHMYMMVGCAAPETKVSIFLLKEIFCLNVNSAQIIAIMHARSGKSSVLERSTCGKILTRSKNAETKIRNGVS